MLQTKILRFISVFLLAFYTAGAVEALKMEPPSYFSERDIVGTDAVELNRQTGHLELRFVNGFHLRIDSKTGDLTGCSRNGTVLIYLPGRFNPADITEINGNKPARLSGKFQLDEILKNGSAAILSYRLESGPLPPVTLNWIFEPAEKLINGRHFEGFSDRIEIIAPQRNLHDLTWHGITARGDEIPGARSIRLACYTKGHGYKEMIFNGKPLNSGRWGSTIDGGQMFHVLGLKKGTLFEYLDDEAHDQTIMEQQNVVGGVDISHQLTIGRVPYHYITPRRYRLLTPAPLTEGLWMELNRKRKNDFQQKYQIPPTELRPVVFIRNFWYTESIEQAIEKYLPAFTDYQFRRCEIGWINERGLNPRHGSKWVGSNVYHANGKFKTWRPHQNELKNALMKEHGGVRGLRKFTDAAHQAGIEVYAWHQTAHGWQGDPILRDRPDWAVYTLDGTFFSGTYAGMLAWFDLGSDFLDYTLDQIRNMKTAVGLDGLWLDMYGTGVYGSVNYAKNIAYPGMSSRRVYTRKLREMGLGLYGEGIAPYVIDSFVIRHNKNWDGHEFVLTGTSPFDSKMMQNPDTGLDFFKLLSYQCFPTDTAWFLNPTPEQKKRAADLKKRNKMFTYIEENIGCSPVGILKNRIGTQWIMKNGAIFFCHEAKNVKIKLLKPDATVLSQTWDGQSMPVRQDGQYLECSMPARSILIIKNAK